MDFKFLTQQEMIDLPMGQTFVFDIEIFRNFFFVAFKIVGSKRVVVFTSDQNTSLNCKALRWFIHRHRFVGFNSTKFDIPILAMALSGESTKDLKRACDKIINDNMQPYEFYRHFNLKNLVIPHTDLIEVCPLRGGLKMYGARLHAPSIEEIPVPVQNHLTEQEKINVGNYCINDLKLTELLYNELSEQLELRSKMSKDYQIALESASDAQIAEKVITHEIKKLTGLPINKPHISPGTTFRYDPPSWVMFCSKQMQDLLEVVKTCEFVVDNSGYPQAPKTLTENPVRIGRGVYKMGLGGLHSSETCQAVKTTQNSILVDVDVASYYPAIILNNGFAPEHIGDGFLEVYREIVTRRLAAKKAGTSAADSLKIVINGLFGKFGSKWSNVYSPKLLAQVTLTGQLALLMLIEYSESMGHTVVSANTDGVVFHLKDDVELANLQKVVSQWEAHTGFNTEETFYDALYSRDVNNYIAIKRGGEAKTKGCYLQPEGIFRFHKNPDHTIVSKGVCNQLSGVGSIRTTIEECTDIREFLIVRQVNGGAKFTGEGLGKVVRWYYRTNTKDPITYVKSGNKVPRSDGAQPLQDLPEKFPDDVDIERYIEIAQEHMYLLGARVRFQKNLSLFTKEQLDAING